MFGAPDVSAAERLVELLTSETASGSSSSSSSGGSSSSSGGSSSSGSNSSGGNDGAALEAALQLASEQLSAVRHLAGSAKSALV